MPRKKPEQANEVVADKIKSFATYIGSKELKVDNVNGSGLTWTPGQTHEVTLKQAVRFAEHPDVWEVVFGDGVEEVPAEAIVEADVDLLAPLVDIESMPRHELNVFLGREFGIDATELTDDQARLRAKAEFNKQLLA